MSTSQDQEGLCQVVVCGSKIVFMGSMMDESISVLMCSSLSWERCGERERDNNDGYLVLCLIDNFSSWKGGDGVCV